MGTLCLWIGVGGMKRQKNVLLIFGWAALTLLLLSLPMGRKSFKNFLPVLPAICIFAGLGTDAIVTWISRKATMLKTAAPVAGLVLILGFGIVTSLSWWPYPQLYTWSWVQDPQTRKDMELLGLGEGLRESIQWVLAHSGKDNPRIACLSGKRIAEYFYSPALLGEIRNLSEFSEYDWMLVRPK
jgi:hypothetical protein